jgi:hypothetical protein
LDAHDGIEWLLLLLLASLVHHSDFLQATKNSIPNHPFANIAILRRPQLLDELRKLLTMKPSDHIPNATGIPPHVKELGLLKAMPNTCGETLLTLKAMIPELKECMKEGITEAAEQLARTNGHVTSSRLEEMFEIKTKIFGELQSVMQAQLPAAVRNERLNPPLPSFGFQNLLYGCYEYDNKADWQVSQDFTFPAGTQCQGWDLWLKGDPGHRSKIRGEWKNTPVRPYRLMDSKHLPPKLWTVYKRSWRPIFLLMEEAPGVSIPQDLLLLDAPKIEELYHLGTEKLKSKVSYIWPVNENKEQRSQREKWSVATSSTKIGRSQVVKWGMQADQSNLGAVTRFNEPPHSNNRPRKKRQTARQGFQSQHADDQQEVDQTLRDMIAGLGAATQQRVEREIAENR